MKTTNYYNTFISVADDCPVQNGTVPPDKKEMTIAALQYDMIAKHPYRYTSDEVIFDIYAQRNDISEGEMEDARVKFFSKGQPCLRASALSKKYGWGIHSNKEGKIAIYGAASEEYAKYAIDESLQQVKAMRSSK